MRKFWLFFLGIMMTVISHANPLPAHEVFQVQASVQNPDILQLVWTIKPGYYLYKDRIVLHESSDKFEKGSIIFPEALEKTDSQGKPVFFYTGQLVLSVPILGIHPGEAPLELTYQGCSAQGFCYPPETKNIALTIDKNLHLKNVYMDEGDNVSTVSETDDVLSTAFTQHHWVISILIFYGLGLLLAFTPCVLPMVPILSGLVVGHGTNMTTGKAFLLSASYVSAMSLTYAAVGAGVALLGSNIQLIFQAPWAIGLFSLIFVLLALSMFGFFELRLPESLQNRIAKITRGGSGGHYLSAALMGCLSTLILSPCITAPMIGALGYIASSGNIVLGMATLFFLGLGMGTPLLLIGTSAGRWLPAAGAWMLIIKNIFGILLLAVAIYLADRILPGPLTMVLWAALCIFSGIFCGALSSASSGRERFFQGLGIMLLIYGLLILIGASMGQNNPLQPLSGLHQTPIQTQETKTVNSVSDLENALTAARGKPVMLDFYADWCASCKLMENSTFQDPALQERLKDFALIKVDLTQYNAQTKALLQQFKVVAPPTFLFFDKQGNPLPQFTLVGEIPAQVFLEQLEKIQS